MSLQQTSQKGVATLSACAERAVLQTLDALHLPYTYYAHPAVYTMADIDDLHRGFDGVQCKNLFLRNAKGNVHFLLIVDGDKRIDLKALAHQIGSSRLSFASEQRLQAHLGLQAGCVGPFGLLNDAQRCVQVLLDCDLHNAGTVLFHPNVHTATIGLLMQDLLAFLRHQDNPVHWVSV